MDISPYLARRHRLLASMQSGVAIIPTAAERPRSRDSYFPFRADSYFHYLTGFPEPDAVLVLIAGTKQAPQSLLFCRERDEAKEIWEGFRYGPKLAADEFAFDAAYPLSDLETQLPQLLKDQPALWFSLGHDALWDTRITNALNAVRAQTRQGHRAPASIQDVRVVIDEMRLIKDAYEIDLMRRSAQIAAVAHRRAMQLAQPGRYEYELEAELLHEFRRQGCQYPAYTPIVASGANTCILHYVDNQRRIAEGDLILVDAGGELAGYAADITRTYPANGHFLGAQAEIYQLVLAAQEAAIAVIAPGVSFNAIHEAALKVLVCGLLDLQLLTGSFEAAIETESYKTFFMHRTSHWLGLDVHDAGEYRQGQDWRTLAPGMMLTVEPGCYIRAASDVARAFHNIGVRIEDDILVTATGAEVISQDAPKTIAEIEEVMRGE